MSQHFNQRHPAVSAVACPSCGAVAGDRCKSTRRSVRQGRVSNKTHVARVTRYQKDGGAVSDATGVAR